MQPNKTKIAMVIGALFLGASGASNADNFDVIVSTLADVAVTETQEMTFGANMFITASQTCTLNGSVPSAVTQAFYNIGTDPAIADAAFGNLTGLGCVNGSGGTAGLYKVVGLSGAGVNIRVSNVTEANGAFSFSPNAGCVVQYDGVNTVDDTCDALIPNSFTTGIVLANADDANSPVVTENELTFAVGGTITIGGTDLSPNTSYEAQFPVEVVYN